jgi:8-oxo-dGTP pyrophosphatase MutT (NUDIX family)
MSGTYKRLARKSGEGVQVAALPYQSTAEGMQVLLVTSRDTGRWTLPKGWPMKRLLPHEAAATEAFEEAGVRGAADEAAIGTYRYPKRLRDGTMVRCRVEVFALAVDSECEEWPEQAERNRAWMSPHEAAERVAEPELQALLLAFTVEHAS